MLACLAHIQMEVSHARLLQRWTDLADVVTRFGFTNDLPMGIEFEALDLEAVQVLDHARDVNEGGLEPPAGTYIAVEVPENELRTHEMLAEGECHAGFAIGRPYAGACSTAASGSCSATWGTR